MRVEAAVGLGLAALAAVVVMALLLISPDPPAEPVREDEPETDRAVRLLPGPPAADGPDARADATEPAAGTDGEAAVRPDDGPRAPVRGIVLDRRDRPVAGATVRLRESDGDPDVGLGVTDDVGLGVTDDSGRFEIQAPAGAGWLVAVVADGYRQEVVPVAAPGGAPVEVRLTRLLRILGRVVDDATSELVEKAALLLQPLSESGEAAGESALGFQISGGEFALPMPAPGRYRLTVTVAGFDGWTRDDIRVSHEEPDAKVEARVARTGPWGALVISVTGPDGTEIRTVNRVLLHHPETGFLAMTPLGASAPVRLEAPEGRLLLQVAVDGYITEVRAAEVPGGGEAEITVSLREAGHVHVVVTDGDGEPARDFHLRILDPEGTEIEYDLRIVEPGAGGFESEPLQGRVGKNQVIPGHDITLKNLRPGRYRLVATREGVNPAETTFDVEPAGTTEARLTLR